MKEFVMKNVRNRFVEPWNLSSPVGSLRRPGYVGAFSLLHSCFTVINLRINCNHSGDFQLMGQAETRLSPPPCCVAMVTKQTDIWTAVRISKTVSVRICFSVFIKGGGEVSLSLFWCTSASSLLLNPHTAIRQIRPDFQQIRLLLKFMKAFLFLQFWRTKKSSSLLDREEESSHILLSLAVMLTPDLWPLSGVCRGSSLGWSGAAGRRPAPDSPQSKDFISRHSSSVLQLVFLHFLWLCFFWLFYFITVIIRRWFILLECIMCDP